ncbi:MAG TPA: hypothetical protein VEQ63_00045 [Bryobacteraceae bacterium]|nr:hypothetical protein [Bryobacteraceae bacterium]
MARTQTANQIQAALWFIPDDAMKWRQLAIALLQEKSDKAAHALERAAELNPYEIDARLGLAVQAETDDRIDDARRYYTEAAARSRRFKPQAALAGFYFRTGAMSKFWQVAAAAAAIDSADVTPVIQLAHNAGGDPDEAFRRLGLRSATAQAGYVRFALENQLFQQAAVAAQLLPVNDTYTPLLLSACDRLIDARSIAPAIAVWNRLAASEALGLKAIDLHAGRSLTNGRFVPIAVRAFNWRLEKVPGISSAHRASGALELEFSGNQPQKALLLYQLVPVLSGRTYKLRIKYQTSELAGPTGLALAVESLAPKPSPPIALTAFEPSDAGTATASFAVPEDEDLIRVALRYVRAPGTVRISGVLALNSADLELER